MSRVTSSDGTTIAYDRTGAGPAVIVVDGALCRRAFGPSADLAKLLSRHFTVYTYDRRGRGESTDTAPYSPAREVEDLAALVEAAGGDAALVGLSSGGALSLDAAASGLAIRWVVAYEPPYIDDDGTGGGAEHERRLQALLDAGLEVIGVDPAGGLRVRLHLRFERPLSWRQRRPADTRVRAKP